MPYQEKPKNSLELNHFPFKHLKKTLHSIFNFFKENRIGFMITGIAVLIFFAPLLLRLDSYSEGGDAMFNAWTLARNHHCILRENCSNYIDGNIFFPNKDSMLYSETQLSAGLLTLPLYFINKNPLFAYNVWTIASYLFAAWFMYLLAKRLSNSNEYISVLSALIFAFAPIKLGAGAVSHLQNLSIFYLPAIILALIRYIDTHTKKYLVLLFAVLTLQFYASWYQMVFVLIALGTFLSISALLKIINIKHLSILVGVILLALLSTYPLAREYIRFSKEKGASFTLNDQVIYSSSLVDYLLPNNNSISGKIYQLVSPSTRKVPFNPDSFSYHGYTMYVVGIFTVIASIKLLVQKKLKLSKKGSEAIYEFKYIVAFGAMGLVGFICSLGPLIRLGKSFAYSLGPGILLAIPAPWLLVTKIFPQLSFIRAIGRISILLLFALCCLLAYMPLILNKLGWSNKKIRLSIIVVTLGVIIELMPLSIYVLSDRQNAFNISTPAVYKLVSVDKKIDDIIILRSIPEYKNDGFPFARVEDVLWSGYHNKYIFNGYSGFEPPSYGKQYADFVDFRADDKVKLKNIGIRFVIIDKLLTRQNSQLEIGSQSNLTNLIYSDSRYNLYEL